jgi:transcriptional regulator with XRE-family HTH domain
MTDSHFLGDIDEMEDETPYGTWVRFEREKKSWTQGQLADESGLSGQQISNIETGRTRNPQNRTREKINRALGQQPSAEIVAAEENQFSILNLGALVGFEPYDEDNLPDATGVYVFYDRTKRPVYVGRATKRPISARVREHSEKFWFKSPVVHSASYLKIDDESLCKQTEQILIKFMRTHLLLNRQGVETETDEGAS